MESGSIGEICTKCLYLIATGCPEYEGPVHSWTEPENDTIKVNCLSSPDSWTVRCVDNTWLGVVGTCPEGENLV